MSLQMEQAINNLNAASLLLEKSAYEYMVYDQERSYQLDQMSASMRMHANDLEELMEYLGAV